MSDELTDRIQNADCAIESLRSTGDGGEPIYKHEFSRNPDGLCNMCHFPEGDEAHQEARCPACDENALCGHHYHKQHTAPPTPENAQVTEEWVKKLLLLGYPPEGEAFDYAWAAQEINAHFAQTLQAARDSAVAETIEVAVNAVPLSGIPSDKIKQIKAAIRSLSPATSQRQAQEVEIRLKEAKRWFFEINSVNSLDSLRSWAKRQYDELIAIQEPR